MILREEGIIPFIRESWRSIINFWDPEIEANDF